MTRRQGWHGKQTGPPVGPAGGAGADGNSIEHRTHELLLSK
jgi:hypothetical protein